MLEVTFYLEYCTITLIKLSYSTGTMPLFIFPCYGSLTCEVVVEYKHVAIKCILKIILNGFQFKTR